MPKVVLLGSDEIALPAFRAVKSLPGVTVAAVYSQPDRPSGRGQEIRPNPVAAWARAEGLPLLQPERLGPEDAASLASLGADLGVVMAYGQLLKDDFLAATARGFVNFHGSLLPSLRGATPVEAAIALGLPATGVTLQQVVRRLDAGPVHAHAMLEPGRTEGRASLRERIGLLAGEMAEASLPAVLDGTSSPVPQDESAVTYTRRLSKSDAALDFASPAEVLDRRVRALEGWPGSAFTHRGETVKVGAAEVADGSGEAGTVLAAGRSGVLIACGERALLITRLQRPGGRMLPAAEFLSGHPFVIGERIESAPMPPLVSVAPFPRPGRA